MRRTAPERRQRSVPSSFADRCPSRRLSVERRARSSPFKRCRCWPSWISSAQCCWPRVSSTPWCSGRGDAEERISYCHLSASPCFGARPNKGPRWYRFLEPRIGCCRSSGVPHMSSPVCALHHCRSVATRVMSATGVVHSLWLARAACPRWRAGQALRSLRSKFRG
jgi:hypothetical protein